jgi:hypothetical protein
MPRLLAALLFAAPAHAALDCAVIDADGAFDVPCAAFVAASQRTAHSFLLEIAGITGDSATLLEIAGITGDSATLLEIAGITGDSATLLEIEGITADAAIWDPRPFAPLAMMFDRPDGSTLVVIDGPAQAAGWTAVGAALATESSAIIAVELDAGITQLPAGEPTGRLQAVVFEPNDEPLWLRIDATAY